MSEFLVYLPGEKGLVGYRRFYFYGIGLSISDNIFAKSVSEETTRRLIREEESRDSALELLAKQTREREERAQKLAESRVAVSEELNEEQEREKTAKVKELQAQKEAFNKEIEKQRKAKEDERKKKEEELRQQQFKLKELEEKLEGEKARKGALEKEKAQNDFTSRERDLADSIRRSEVAISKIQAKIEETVNLLSQKDANAFLFETIKRNQEAILRKEEEILKLEQRYQSSEKSRHEAQAAFEREEKERQREETETQLAKLEEMMHVVDGDLSHKWCLKELESLKDKIATVRLDYERGNYQTVKISLAGLLGEVDKVDKKLYADEKIESQREHLARSFLEALRYQGYEAGMFQKDPKDPRSSVVIRGNTLSGKSIEITLAFGEVYSIKFSGMKESECCREESAIREVMHKFGISWQPLDLLNQSFLKNPDPKSKFVFQDDGKKVELTKQICG